MSEKPRSFTQAEFTPFILLVVMGICFTMGLIIAGGKQLLENLPQPKPTLPIPPPNPIPGVNSIDIPMPLARI